MEHSFEVSYEVNCRIDYEAFKAERQTLEYPGCPASIEINDLTFEDDSGKAIETLDELKSWILNSNSDHIEMEAWDDVKERSEEDEVCRDNNK